MARASEAVAMVRAARELPRVVGVRAVAVARARVVVARVEEAEAAMAVGWLVMVAVIMASTMTQS